MGLFEKFYTIQHNLVVSEESTVIRYKTGEVALVGDRVVDDVWLAVVEHVIASKDDIGKWGVDGPGLMLNTKEAGFVFERYHGDAWDEIVFLGRSE
jgi:hypothetical protein